MYKELLNISAANLTTACNITQIGSFEIPFTKKLLKNKLFYIKTEQKPIIINKNEGLKLIINGKEYM